MPSGQGSYRWQKTKFPDISLTFPWHKFKFPWRKRSVIGKTYFRLSCYLLWDNSFDSCNLGIFCFTKTFHHLRHVKWSLLKFGILMLASKPPLQPTQASHQFNRRKQSYFFLAACGIYQCKEYKWQLRRQGAPNPSVFFQTEEFGSCQNSSAWPKQ